MTLEDHYELRGALVERLALDLCGPPAESDPDPAHETLHEAPITRYVSGVLYPLSADPIDPNQDAGQPEGTHPATEDGDDERTVSLANVRYPSSMAVSFAVAAGVASLRVHVSAVRFEPVLDEVAPEQRRKKPTTWTRVSFIAEPLDIDVSAGGSTRWLLTDSPELTLYCRVRNPDKSGTRSVTVGLLNTQKLPPDEYHRDQYSWFHPTIRVAGIDEVAPFRARLGLGDALDEDIDSYRLLYRHAAEFATGHGCSVDWAAVSPTEAQEVWSTFVPQFDVPLAESNPSIKSEWFSLHLLATSDRQDVLNGLRKFVSDYQSWISTTAGTAAGLVGDLRRTADRHLELCRGAALRMLDGVNSLEESDDAWMAFRGACEAMLIQRSRTDWIKRGSTGEPSTVDPTQAWRPFQLAFILQAIRGVVDPSHQDRDLVDLLWFPTGGGKTEAYLGLIAFTILLRRYRRRGGGVTALMRYTLRLLTIQQFERAATLICALELTRRADESSLGGTPISIGLWVGADATPLRRGDAQKALDKIRSGSPVEKGNPIQIHRCPWCGVPLDHKNYWLARVDPRLVIACKNEECEFNAGLPAWIIDEDVYARRPSLLIGTADKFASLPWRDDAQKIFNLGSGDPPPELIIQDELHLISGPLGTLAGLYETAIDVLCTENGHRPKVVASTATIRRASEQVRALFARDVKQFPAPGIDARDNWFSVEADPSRTGSRLYVGLMAPGTSQTTLLVRTYAALLQNITTIPASDETRDAYWTLLGYFNSLRVLGGARMQVNDDVPDRQSLLATREGAPVRTAERVIELTSRESSSKIPEHLRDMSRGYPDPGRLDIILATNMISVGVDIDRLSLMAVMGQPQSASEYIQATSRVGRSLPGLVVVMLNPARSRDRSHYESFRAFHQALYRQVEASSVTPFSPRATDRGLHAVLIGLARLLVPAFSGNEGASAIGSHRADLTPIIDAILQRVANVAPEQRDAVEGAVERLIAEWTEVADECDLVYANKRQPTAALLIDASDFETDPEGHFRTLWSLRDVDTESNLYPVRD